MRWSKFELKICCVAAGEIALELRTVTALDKNITVASSTHVAILQPFQLQLQLQGT